MKLIETKNAVGHVLCHDLTRIVPGEFKGAQFRKGHIVTEEDIPMLLSMGTFEKCASLSTQSHSDTHTYTLFKFISIFLINISAAAIIHITIW